ncbi:hypothetical protein GQ457_05G030440 [Hibiscus cannabinus]
MCRWRHNLRNAGVVHNNIRDIRVLIQTIGKYQPYANPTIMVCIPENVLQCKTFWGAVVPLIHFGVVEYQCNDRVLRQFNYHQPIPRLPPALWEEKYMRWAEDLSPLEASDFEFNTEYYTWFLENGKPFLVSVEAENKWREDLRCLKHRHLTSEFGQSFEEPTYEPTFACSSGWSSSWNSVEDPIIHVSDNLWDQPPFGNVSEQPPIYGGNSSSQHAYTDDEGYIPEIQGTPPSIQVDDEWFNEEQTPDQPRRIVYPPRRYDQTSSQHRQELLKRRQK